MAGIEVVLPREAAASRFELPADRIGDLVVVAERSVVLGTSASRHDLSQLELPLRSHGGISEQRVPRCSTAASTGSTAAGGWRNFDAFDLVLIAPSERDDCSHGQHLRGETPVREDRLWIESVRPCAMHGIQRSG